jgi:hypothetical protein
MVRTAVATLPPDDARRALLNHLDVALRLVLGFRKS